MHLLVVEGNSKEVWEERSASGGIPYHQRFKDMLNILQPLAKVEFAFPADSDTLLPSIEKLVTFDGILWTGSSFCVNDPTPTVQRQLTFAEDVFNSGVPFYGSCWGLQIASVVAGGSVAACTAGREIGISSPIELTEEGKNSTFFQGRTGKFNALCVHSDEVVKLPKNSSVLAKNNHSKVQAMTIKFKKSNFFGVQYHPEFRISDIAFITRYLSEDLIEDGTFKSKNNVENSALNLENKIDLPVSVSNYTLHIQEVKFWLASLYK